MIWKQKNAFFPSIFTFYKPFSSTKGRSELLDLARRTRSVLDHYVGKHSSSMHITIGLVIN